MFTLASPAHLSRSARRARHGTSNGRSLAGASVLIVDGGWATATLIRRCLEDDFGAAVEVVRDYEDALDVLGVGSRPVRAVLLDPAVGIATADALMTLLRDHRANIAVTLHGMTPPEKLAFPQNFVGAAAYTHFGTSTPTATAADEVLRAGLTVRTIIDQRIIPQTLDWTSATAIYQGDPGQPFPLTLRT